MYAVFMRPFRYLDTLTTAFIVVLLVSNLLAQKLIRIGPFTTSGAVILFPSYLYLRRCLHRGVWLRRIASRHMAV